MQKTPKIHPSLDYIPPEIACANDYAVLAANFIPADRLAYIEGGSGQDTTLQNNQRVFNEFAISPSVFADTARGTTQTSLVNQDFKHPIMLAPVAYQSLVNPQGELATAYAAASTDSCMIASTLTSYTLEEIATKSGSERWFQLYLQANEKDTEALIKRAEAAAYQAIVLTVDAAVQVPSLRAMRAGFRFPKAICAANLKGIASAAVAKNIFENYQQNALTPERLRHVLAHTKLPVLVKGVLNPNDAEQLKGMGVAGLVVSNHGGRTLDGVPASLSVLPTIRERVGKDYPLLFDGGIRSGNDVFKAIALGADAVLIGRLQLYALAVAGALGVAHMLKLLRQEFELAMAHSACTSIEDVKAVQLHRY